MSQSSWFDVTRPKFLNTATFHSEIVDQLLRGIQVFLQKRSINATFNIDSHQISYESYKNWLLNGHNDVKINAGNITNLQLFWIAVGSDAIAREEDFLEIKSKDEFFHSRFKKNIGFRDAFNCSVTEQEQNEWAGCWNQKTVQRNELFGEVMLFVLRN